MKSILFLCESLEVGGAERALYTLLNHINLNKFNVTVCPLCDIGYYSKLIKQINGINYKPILVPQDKGIKCYFYKLKYNLIYKILHKSLIYKFFIPKDNDIEIAFCEGFSTKILATSTNHKSKKIAWVHTDLLHNNWPIDVGVYNNLNDEINSYNKFNNIIGVSNTVTQNLTKLFSNNKNITTLYNLIDDKEIRSLSSQDIETNFDNTKLNIVSIGRLAKVKGYDRLIKTCAKLINEDKLNIILTIVGGGIEFDYLNNLILELKVTKYIRLVGNQNNPYPFLKMADLYVCPSYKEGYNIALAEAIILEKPCISTNCSGPDEILENGKYGYLVENTEEALYSCLKDVVYNRHKLEFLKTLSIQRKVFFDINKNLSKIESLFSE